MSFFLVVNFCAIFEINSTGAFKQNKLLCSLVAANSESDKSTSKLRLKLEFECMIALLNQTIQIKIGIKKEKIEIELKGLHLRAFFNFFDNVELECNELKINKSDNH